jgi:pyruvate,water dikinase
MTDFVVDFGQLGIGDRPRVGGKGASLGELTGAGIPVPPGCVVTTGAFTRSLEALDPTGALRREVAALDAGDHDRITAVCAAMRDRVEAAPLPGDVCDAIAAGVAALAPAPVAVRSSATSEDSAEASFAGLQDTYLWIRGAESVTEHVRRCWASLYSVESVTYRRRLGLPEDGLAMGVVIQQMVDARSAGVMFTRSPSTGDRSVVTIESSWGLGSAVVSGEVTPDCYVVSKVTGDVTTRTIATKTWRHRPEAAGAGVVEEEVPAELQRRPSVSEQEVRELVALGRRIERHYGSPQDIEWAIDADGAIAVLQSRPETVWASRDAAPVAAPKAKAFDHVLALLGGGAAK